MSAVANTESSTTQSVRVELRGLAERYWGSVPADWVTVSGSWDIDLRFRPVPTERTFRYRIRSLLVGAQGAAYYDASAVPSFEADVLGQDIREQLDQWPAFVQIAALDAFFGNLPVDDPLTEDTLTGKPSAKAHARAAFIGDSVARILGPGATVLNVGAVGTIVECLSSMGFRVRCTDLEGALIGQDLAGARVHPATSTAELAAESDLLLITGMTLSNETIDDLLAIASAAERKVMLFCETGAHLAPHLVRIGRVDAAISEPFPFYIFQGNSPISLYLP